MKIGDGGRSLATLGMTKKVGTFLMDMVFPKDIYCISCGSPIKGGDPMSLCEGCRKDLLYRQPPVCRRCGRFTQKPGPGFCEGCAAREPVYDRGAAAVVYEGNVRKIIYGLKYGGKGYLAANIAAIMEPILPSPSTYDIIVPVPMHKSKKKERGYCQTTLIARQLGKLTGQPVVEDGLIRTRKTEPMSGLHRDLRARNIQGAFEAPELERIRGKRVLLIDDLLTTGSTADECSRVLKQAGAVSVSLAVFAATAPEREVVS